MMKYVMKFLYIAIAVAMACMLVALIFFAPEKDYKEIIKCAIRLIGYLLIIFGIRRRRVIPHQRRYEKAYKDILRGVFSEDKKSYSTLMEAISYFNQEEYQSAHQLLDTLEKNCKNVRDYSAVYTFRALVYRDQKKPEQAIATYEKLVQYDMTNSLAWSNLGLCYRKEEQYDKALEAYTNAIRFDPQNALAYSNMACLYIYTGEVEQALSYALKALELDSKLCHAMSVASMAYKALGNEEESERYCKLYSVNGGKEKKLRAILSQI